MLTCVDRKVEVGNDHGGDVSDAHAGVAHQQHVCGLDVRMRKPLAVQVRERCYPSHRECFELRSTAPKFQASCLHRVNWLDLPCSCMARVEGETASACLAMCNKHHVP